MKTAAKTVEEGTEIHEPRPAESKALQPQIVREIIREGRSEADPMAIIEARNKMMVRLRELAIRSTTPSQWCDQGGKPYLMAGGAEAVARMCGIKVTEVSNPPRREEHSDKNGPYFEYVYTGTVSLPGDFDRIEGATGSCTSRDSMLGTGGGNKTIEDIDPGDIRKKAQTNLLQRGITQLLGLRNLEWSDLAPFGIFPEGAPRVDYKAGAKGGGQGQTFTFGFGKNCKGKTPAEVSDKDLVWYLEAYTKSLADPEKAKWKDGNERGLKAVQEEIARRKNAASGAAAPTNGPSMWTRIQTLADDYRLNRGEKDATLIALVKNATGSKPGKDLDEKDFELIEMAVSAAVAEAASDIPY